MQFIKSRTMFLAIAAALLLAACGSAAAPASTSAPAVTPTAVATAAPTGVPTEVPTETPALEPSPTTAATSAAATAEPVAGPTATPEPAPQVIANTRLNLNTATGEDYLAAIPDFSSRMVREFLEYRPYISIQQFRREIGKYVDDAQVAFYEQYVYVPIAVDEADAETLKQIPGVDDATAADLIAGRPYGSNDAFLAALAGRLPANEVAVAAAYLAAQ